MSRDSDKLSLEDIEKWIAECNTVGIEQDIAKQLAATMRSLAASKGHEEPEPCEPVEGVADSNDD
jgi:hypothetical protein